MGGVNPGCASGGFGVRPRGRARGLPLRLVFAAFWRGKSFLRDAPRIARAKGKVLSRAFEQVAFERCYCQQASKAPIKRKVAPKMHKVVERLSASPAARPPQAGRQICEFSCCSPACSMQAPPNGAFVGCSRTRRLCERLLQKSSFRREALHPSISALLPSPQGS